MSRDEGKDIVLGKTVEIINGVKVQELPIIDVVVKDEELPKTQSDSLREYFKK